MNVQSIEKMAFPAMDQTQMEAVSQIGELVSFKDGEFLIEQGQKDYPFYVIRSGKVNILEGRGEDSTLIASHGANEFTDGNLFETRIGSSVGICPFLRDSVSV